MSKSAKFRELLKGNEIIVMPGGYDAMSARLIEETGFRAMLASGAGISNAQLGWADLGLTTMTEITQAVSRMAEVTNIPIMADCDTGFGNAINLVRTTRELEKAGAAAIQIEDQVAPKKCGHFTGKHVVPKIEMVNKIKAVVDARRSSELVIVARTDARAVHGLEDAIERCHAYAEAGADVTFIEAPRSLEELQLITKELKGIPQMANMVEGGLTPLLSAQELQDMGFKIMICANTALRAAIKNIRNALEILQREGSHKNVLDYICTWEERQNLFKLQDLKMQEEKYLQSKLTNIFSDFKK